MPVCRIAAWSCHWAWQGWQRWHLMMTLRSASCFHAVAHLDICMFILRSPCPNGQMWYELPFLSLFMGYVPSHRLQLRSKSLLRKCQPQVPPTKSPAWLPSQWILNDCFVVQKCGLGMFSASEAGECLLLFEFDVGFVDSSYIDLFILFCWIFRSKMLRIETNAGHVQVARLQSLVMWNAIQILRCMNHFRVLEVRNQAPSRPPSELFNPPAKVNIFGKNALQKSCCDRTAGDSTTSTSSYPWLPVAHQTSAEFFWLSSKTVRPPSANPDSSQQRGQPSATCKACNEKKKLTTLALNH